MRRPTDRLEVMADLIACVLTRRVRSTVIPLLILAGMALIPTEVGAGPITYSIVNYPTLQNGFSVSGTITTDGSTGTMLPGTDITDWQIFVKEPNGAEVIALTSINSTNQSTTFDATPTTISVGSSETNGITFGILPGDFTSISWQNNQTLEPTYSAQLSGTLWSASLPTVDSPIATAAVPEPSSAVLASIGAVLAYGWSRHRRVQHLPEAN
jgi:hypothetical protein